MRTSEKDVDTLAKEMGTAKAQIPLAAPQTGEYKSRWSAYYQLENQHEKAVQLAKFHRLRLQTRLDEARKKYAAAFQKGEPWPDPEEFRQYKIDKDLRSAPRDWNVRLKEKLAKDREKSSHKSSSH